MNETCVTDGDILYHVWFATKNRKWLLVGEIEDKIKQLIKEIAAEKYIDLLACETMVDHVHLLLRSKPEDLSKAMFFIKGISSRKIFLEFPDLKLDAETISFRQTRYGAKPVPIEVLKSTLEYIKTQKDRPE